MANIQGAGTRQNTYDAIVVGSGISGGWAAKELTEKGLKTLVLERGRDVKHGDYPTAMKDSWEFEGRTKPALADVAKQQKQNRTGYTTHPATAHWFVNDLENPYSEDKPFDWMRGYHVTVNGHDVAPERSPDSLLLAAVPAGESHVTIEWRPGPMLRLAYWGCLTAWLVLVLFAAIRFLTPAPEA